MGYTELDRPPLSARVLTRALVVPGGLWSKFEVCDETGSTNADVAAAAAAGAPEGLVVVAESQLAGRGRRDRQWTSPPRAGLTVSVLLRPASAGRSDGREGVLSEPGPGVPPSAFGWLPLLAGVALVEAVTRVGAVESTLKWPNDLLIGERKCAGILAEVSGDAVVIGIGVNVSTRAGELPATTGLPATSLLMAGAASTDRSPLLKALLRSLERWYAGWREAGGDAEMCGLLAAYQRHCATIGRRVRVLLPDGAERTGQAVTVDSAGQLVIRTDEGAEFRVSAGDVLHVR